SSTCSGPAHRRSHNCARVPCAARRKDTAASQARNILASSSLLPQRRVQGPVASAEPTFLRSAVGYSARRGRWYVPLPFAAWLVGIRFYNGETARRGPERSRTRPPPRTISDVHLFD